MLTGAIDWPADVASVIDAGAPANATYKTFPVPPSDSFRHMGGATSTTFTVNA